MKSARRILIGTVAAGLAGLIWLRVGPLPEALLDPRPHQSTVVLDRNGRVLYEALSAREARSRWLGADELPQNIVDATVAAEDKRFFDHFGLDPLAIGRATLRNLRSLRVVEGGSTITQQVAKQLLGARRRSLRQKLYETIVAIRLEHRLSKREILAMYLNLAPYGNQSIGIEAAARGYFGAPPANLTIAQAAYLASLPQRPSQLDPYRSPRAAGRRQSVVLQRMVRAGLISPAQARAAREERLQLRRDGRSLAAPHYVERVLAAHGDRPARITTPLDLDLQRDVLGIVEMERRRLANHGAYNVAVVVLDNATGQWRAWEGSGDYFDAEHGGAIDGAITPRQPGSALKPFTYAVAFENGVTPATVLADLPSHFPTAEEGVLYAPRNYDGMYRGPMRARVALAGSENVPAVALLSQIGVPSLLRFFRQAGFSTFDRTADYYGLGLTLGNAEVRLDELVRAYSIFARGGVDHRGRRIVSSRTAFWMTDILSDRAAREFIFGSGSSLDFPFDVAVKTGTSQAYHDNWTVGYTKNVTVGVWVGNFDRRPLRNSSGVTGAAPIFHQVLLAAEKRLYGSLPSPDSVILLPDTSLQRTRVCALSGMAPGANCPGITREWVPALTSRCSWHPRPNIVTLPVQYQAWSGTSTPNPRVPGPDPRAPSPEPHFRIASPPAGAVYLIDPTLRREFQSLPLRVESSHNDAVTWLVDGKPVGRARADESLDWPLATGEHRIVARDRAGRTAEATIIVR